MCEKRANTAGSRRQKFSLLHLDRFLLGHLLHRILERLRLFHWKSSDKAWKGRNLKQGTASAKLEKRWKIASLTPASLFFTTNAPQRDCLDDFQKVFSSLIDNCDLQYYYSEYTVYKVSINYQQNPTFLSPIIDLWALCSRTSKKICLPQDVYTPQSPPTRILSENSVLDKRIIREWQDSIYRLSGL